MNIAMAALRLAMPPIRIGWHAQASRRGHAGRFGVVMAALCLALPLVALAQTSQPAGFDFDALIKKAAERPIEKVDLRSADGKKLGDADRKAIEKSDGLMAQSETDRETGDYSAAARQAREASSIRKRILGENHHLSVIARVRAEAMEDWAKIPKDKQSQLAESDAQLKSSLEFLDKGEFKPAREAAQKALTTLEAVLPMDHVETGAAVLQLGSALLDLSELDAADANMNRALKIVEGAYGRDHPETARVLDRLGWLRFRQARRAGGQAAKKMREAIDLFERAVAIYRKTLGEDVDLAESLDNMATARTYLGDTRRALVEKCRALVIRREVLGPDARDTGVSYSNLAWMFDRAKQTETAVRLREQALAIFEKRLGPEHPYALMELGKLAEHHLTSGQNEEAIRLYEDATRRDAKHAEESRPGVLERMGALGIAYIRAGRIEDGVASFERTYDRALKDYEKGRQLPALRTLFEMANTCRQHRLFAQGVKYLKKIIEYDNQNRQRADDLSMTRRAAMLGTLYIELGRLDEGKRVLSEVIERIRKLTDEENIQMAGVMLNLARIHEKQGDLEAAERLCEQVMRISEAKLVRNTFGPAYAQLWLGRIYTQQKRFGLADFALHEAETLFKQFEESDPSGTVMILQERSKWHALKGDREKAVALLRDALKRSRELAKKAESVHSDALTAEILKDLLDRTEKGNPGDKKDRAAWQSELKKLLLSLKKKLALSADEVEWLKALAG